MSFNVFVVGHRIKQTEHVNAGITIEAIGDGGIRRFLVARQFQFRVVDDDVAFIVNSKLASNLQNDFGASTQVWMRE